MGRQELAAAMTELLAALNRLRDIHGRIGENIGDLEQDRRRELVNTRRELADCMAAVSAPAEVLFLGLSNADVLGEYRRLFSAMRSSAALHQASWPAVSVTDDIPAYAKSADQVRDAHRTFDQWVRMAIAQRAETAPVESAQ